MQFKSIILFLAVGFTSIFAQAGSTDPWSIYSVMFQASRFCYSCTGPNGNLSGAILTPTQSNFVVGTSASATAMGALVSSNPTAARTAAQVALIAFGNYLANSGGEAQKDTQTVLTFGGMMQQIVNTNTVVLKEAVHWNGTRFDVRLFSGGAVLLDSNGNPTSIVYNREQIEAALSSNLDLSSTPLSLGPATSNNTLSSSNIQLSGTGACIRGCQVFGSTVIFVSPDATGTVGDFLGSSGPATHTRDDYRRIRSF